MSTTQNTVPTSDIAQRRIECEVNSKYHEILGYRWQIVDNAARVLTALSSSSAVVGWSVWETSIGRPALGALLGIAALLSIFGAVIAPSTKERAHRMLRFRWLSLATSFELLELDQTELNNEDVRKQYRALVRQKGEITAEQHVRPNARLLEQLRRESLPES